MAGENAYIDENSRNTITALANDMSGDIYNVRINPITGALVVEGNVTSGNTSIGSTIPGGTAGSVLFLDIGSTLAEDNDYFYYDPVAHQFAIGHNSPTATLDVLGTFKYVDGNEGDTYVLISDASGNAEWNDLATNTTFIDNIIANDYFTTNLANNNNFITTLVSNSTFINDVTTIITTEGSLTVQDEGVDLTSLATTLNFVGAGVTATGSGPVKTITIPGGAAGGTVTSVSVTTANGVSGSVANPTTTPAITLTLGAITPSSVNSVVVSGSSTPTLAVTGATAVSGTNTGDQTITLTGDVTGSGTGSFAATIGSNKVTYAKMQAVSTTSKLLGSSSTTTAVQEITLGTGLSMTGTTLNASGSAGLFASGVSGGPASSVTQTITHGLGYVPPSIELTGYGSIGGGGSSQQGSSSTGTCVVATGDNFAVYLPAALNGATTTPSASNTFAIYLAGMNAGGGAISGSATGFVQNVTSTQFDIVWTVVSGGVGSIPFIWKAR